MRAYRVVTSFLKTIAADREVPPSSIATAAAFDQLYARHADRSHRDRAGVVGRSRIDPAGRDRSDGRGRRAYYPASVDAIDPVTLDIARQIRNQYTLAYAPPNQALDGSYRTIRVTLAGPERFTVRTRAG